MASLIEKCVNIDRRIIFITVFLGAALPLVFPFIQDVPIKPETIRFYDAIESLGADDVIILSMDYSPETKPEVDPMSEAVLRHCFHKGVRVIGLVNTIPNIPIGEGTMLRIARATEAVYGRDYIYLGFKPEPRAIQITFSEEIRNAFPTDFYGNPLDDSPLMSSIHSFDDVAMAVVTTSDDVSLEWLLTANSRFDVKVIMGISSNFYPSFTPYIESRQVIGALGGMKGGAEYEKLLMEAGIVDEPGDSIKGMATQSAVHLLIIFYILMGNIGFILLRKRKGRGAAR